MSQQALIDKIIKAAEKEAEEITNEILARAADNEKLSLSKAESDCAAIKKAAEEKCAQIKRTSELTSSLTARKAKLHARRQIMAYLYDVPEPKKADESKSEYKERTKDNAHPVVEKLFREYAPKYDERAKAGKKGGYTRMYKLGARRGDAAPVVVLELV